jgi:hypothetical protein
VGPGDDAPVCDVISDHDEHHELPTARTTLRIGYFRVLVFCNSCRHQADAGLQKIVESGRGDVSLTAVSLLAVRHRPHRLCGDLARQTAAVVSIWRTRERSSASGR